MSDASQDQTVRVDETYEVTALRLNDDGDGVVNIDGLTVFVPNLLPQESATITISSVHRRFARGQVLERTTTAPDRLTPVCDVHGVCGGCQLQHVSYKSQLEHKRQTVAWALSRLPQPTPPEILPTLGIETPFRYRNHIQVPITWDDTRQKILFGFFEKGSHEIVETSVCHLESIAMERTVRYIVDWLTELGADAARIVHHAIVRESWTTGEQMVILSVRREHAFLRKHLVDLIEHEPIVSAGFTVQPQSDGPVWGQKVEMVAGKPHLTEQMHGLEFLVSPRSFFQVNTAQATRLYETALCFADLSGSEQVLDAYCGTGTISLMLAKHAKSVIGIESIGAAISDAQNNARHNGISNAKFITGEVESELPRLVARGERFDVVVLDPPRKGVHKNALNAVIAAKPKRIVYVSCNPATLGRDIATLVAGGYEARVAQPVDMFPQTSHVESVCLLERKVVTT